MSLHKRGGFWHYEFILDGIRYRASTRSRNKDVARNYETKRRNAVLDGKFGIKKRGPVPGFEKYAPTLLDEIRGKSGDKHPRTVEFYEQTLARINRYKPLAQSRLNEIDGKLLGGFVGNQLAKGYRKGTIRGSLAVIRRILILALDNEIVDTIPRKALKKWFAAMPARNRDFVLTGALRDEFIQGLPEPCRTVAQFLVDTGLRVSECCALQWDRISTDSRSGLRYILVNRRSKSKKPRYVPLTAKAAEIIEHQRTLSRSNYVFVRFGERVAREKWYTEPLSRHTLSQQFTARRREMKLSDDAVLHSCRHTYLTDLGASGADAFTIRALAGHASITTSQNYIHPIDDTMIKSVERLTQYRERDAADRRAKLEIVAKTSGVPTISPTDSHSAIVEMGK